MNFDTAIEFAKSINAKIVLPTDPKRERRMDEPADVAKTWDLYREDDFDVKVKRIRVRGKRS